MPTDDELRAAWLDERDQLLRSIRDHLLVLQRPEGTEEEHTRAVLEIRRAAHTLKGAARVMGDLRAETLSHRLEQRLPDPGEPVDPEAARADTLEFLHAMAPEGAEAVAPPPARPAADEPREPPRTAPPSTLRVSARHLADLAAIAEDLTVLVTRGVRRLPTPEEVALELAPLRSDLRRLESAAGTDRRASAALERFVSWLTPLLGEHRASLRALRERVRALEATSRALRAVRFDSAATLLESAVLETARALGREVRFELAGGAVEIDRRVVDELLDPLAHLLRNAVDHGIEPPEERERLGKPRQGCVRVHARARGADLSVEVEDDGRGIPMDLVAQAARERGLDTSEEALLRWIFEPGFTTRREATTISGRGLGLDVVRTRIVALHGRVEVEPRPGLGARFRLRVPADLSIARGQVVRVGEARHVVLESSVERVFHLSAADRRVVGGRVYVHHGGTMWPLVDARALLGAGVTGEVDGHPALALYVGERRLVLVVDAMADAREVVVKPLGERVRRGGFVLGASVLEDGYLACVLDPAALAAHALATTAPAELPRSRTRRVLVVDDSLTTRQLMVSILRTAGYDVASATQGEEAWERILRDPPDLVVSDVEMPVVDGFRLLARIKSSPQTARLPVVLVTARSSDDDRRRALELGADGYVVKGRFDQRELLDILSELLP